MGSAIGLALALPLWYFSALLMPFEAGPLTLVPAIGGTALVVGTALGIRARDPSLLLFGALALISHVFVALAGFLRGALQGSDSPEILIFFLLQLAAAIYLTYRSKRARLAATLLAVFTATYALFATFMASMALHDTWL